MSPPGGDEEPGDAALTVLRLALGVVFFAHGAQKMLGWFGGPGFSGAMKGFTEYLHIPAPLAFLAIAAEFFGGLALIAGLLGRVAAAGIAVNMIVAAAIRRSHGLLEKEDEEGIMDTVFLVGRIVVGLYFLYAGYNHFKNLGFMSGYVASKGIPAPKLAAHGSPFLRRG